MSVTINQANYGSAVYGTARYGLFFVTINNGVSATGAIEAPSVGGFEVDVTEVLNSVSATGSIGTVTATGKATTTLTGVRAINSTNPEFGLTLDGTAAEGTLSGSFSGSTSVSTVFAGELTLPSTFSNTVPFWEIGGTGTGSWFGVAKISNVYHLRVRAGRGSTSTNLLSDATDVVIANVPISQIPEFDGNTHTVAWEIKPSAAGRIKLWIDGRQVINQETSGGAGLQNGNWAGGDIGGWGVGRSGIAGGTTDSGGTQYQAPADRTWSGTIQSRLRYYSNELAYQQNANELIQVNISEVLDSVSATGSIGSLGVGIDTTLSGVVGTTNTPAVQPNVTEIIATGVTATGAVGEVTVLAGDVTVRISGVGATGAIQPVTLNVFEVDVTEILVGVEATGAIGTTVEHTTALLPSVSATASVGTTQENVVEKLPTQVITGSAGSVGVGVTPTIVGVSATSSVGIIEARTLEVLASVSATGAVGSVQVNPVAGLEGLEATGEIGVLELKPDEVLVSVSGTTAVGTLKVNVKKLLTSVSATFNVGIITATGVQFDFEAIKALYDRSRTVYVEGFTEAASERTVYVQREIRLVYVERFSTSAERRARASKAA